MFCFGFDTLDPSAIDVDGEFEHILLKSPTLSLYSAYLQTVCLVKNVFVNPYDIQALSLLHYSDIRRLLLNLQFWIDSNAGAGDEHGITIRSDLRSNLPYHNTRESTKDVSFAGQIKDSPCEVTQKSANVDFPGGVLLNASTNDEVDKTRITCNPMQQLDAKEQVQQTDSSCTGTVTSEITNIRLTNRSKSNTSVSFDEKKSPKLCEVNNKLVNETLTTEDCHKAQLPNEIKIDSEKAWEFEKCCYNQEPIDEALVLEKGESISPEKDEIEMHNLCLESLLGLRNVSNNGACVLETLQTKVRLSVCKVIRLENMIFLFTLKKFIRTAYVAKFGRAV